MPFVQLYRGCRFAFHCLWISSVTFVGCAPKLPQVVGNQGNDAATVSVFQDALKDAPVAQRPYVAAAKPILEAIAVRDYTGFYNSLSSHARASSHPHQFVAPTEEHPKPQEPLKELTIEQFVEWMKKMEEVRGIPDKVDHVHVETTNPKILSGQGEGAEMIDVMFAIGAMPKEIPNDIRRASIRSKIKCKLSEQQLKRLAEHQNTTVEEIQKDEAEEADEDQGTYLNLKFVLVEEGGNLKVGYFEFMPPSMLD